MMIREQSRKIQLLRTHYIAEKKRTVSKMFASFSSLTDNIKGVDSEIIKQLDSIEKEKLTSWFISRRDNRILEEQRQAVDVVAAIMERSSAALSNEIIANDLTNKQALAIYEQMNSLSKSLRKAGFKKSDIMK